MTCSDALFHGKLTAAANSLTIGAEYGECSTAGGNEIVIDMTGCDYVFHAGETLGQHKVDGSMDIKCIASGETIDIEEPATGCEIEIHPQTGLTTLTYTNHTMAKDFDVDIQVGSIKYTQNALCPGGEGLFFNGTYSGKSTMVGENAEERSV